MKTKFNVVCVLFLMLAFAVACNPVEEKNAADAVAKNFFESVIAQDFDKALTFYGQQFFQKTSREEWLSSLKNINAKLGDLQKYEQTSWRINANAGTALNGTVFTYQYKTTYSKYPADETLVLFKPTGGKEIQIIGHNINSAGFLK
jgi:hypothetical protein